MTFPAAGPAEDLRRDYLRGRVEERRGEAVALLSEARDLLAAGDSEAAEQRARQGLERQARAFDWAEDTPDEQAEHDRLDLAGRWVRETFGCRLTQDGTSYSRDCPVDLGHNRIGLSVGGAATRTCSLCGGDLSECEHMPDTAYMVPGGDADLGWCRVCLRRDGCDHSPDRQYRTDVTAIITKLQLQEVSLVSRPAHPEARIANVSVSTTKLVETLGPEFRPGMPVSCDKCLQPCPGLNRPDLPHG